ncbi:MAG: OmpH family outer membrane protein [Candidatus Marinimicrobia bacterium]|nr:OmpH family outer membrane protein [Candidatus Neomarinimicrobiota bacterium]MDP6612329.1 OmpH family outer membrane protein [Candidatus Neomarinimicrobiota bacterium]
MIRKTITIVGIMATMLPLMLVAQNKIGFVQSDRIRAEYEEFKDAEAQLQLEYRQVNAQYNKMVVELDSIKQAFDTQRLMSSPDWRKEKEAEIAGREKTIQNFQVTMVGPEGELYRRQAQLEFDILSKVKRAVDKVAAAKSIDFIIDGSVALLYGNPTHDLTDDVLFELRKYNVSVEKDSDNEK